MIMLLSLMALETSTLNLLKINGTDVSFFINSSLYLFRTTITGSVSSFLFSSEIKSSIRGIAELLRSSPPENHLIFVVI